MQHISIQVGNGFRLCANVNVSRRTLEVAFQTIACKSPLQFLTHRRLSRAYIDLKRAKNNSTHVTEVACAHGFTELGRFASRYQKRFGELPSKHFANMRCNTDRRL